MAFTADLRRQQPGWSVPELDPASGGIDASVLFLFEKPGPRTARANGGSGFISLNNNDPTAEATFRFALEQNRLSYGRCLFANVIPWWDGAIRVTGEQRRLAGDATAALMALLPAVEAIVLVGATARLAWTRGAIRLPPKARLWSSDHPGPQVRAAWPQRWRDIPTSWPTRADLLKPLDL